MSNSNMKFQWGLTTSDPEQSPVLFVGQAVHLNSLTWDEVKCKLEPRVTEEAWKRGLSCVTAVPGEACELWPRAASVAALPAKASRHAAPSRAHQLAKIVREALAKGTEDVVLVCRKRDVLASSVAVARSAPLYSARSATAPLSPAPPAPRAPAVQIILAKEAKPAGDCESEEEDEEDIGSTAAALNNMSLSDEEMATIHDLAEGTRLAARITDMPCNIMGVDQFIEEAVTVASALGIPPPTVIRGAELEARGFGGIAGVGRAAGSEPALVSLSWSVPHARASVAWVGKGIVYDTGGLSIKGRTSMVGMKGDCGGAAAVLGAFMVAARAKPTYNLHAVLCLAENAVGPLATRPDDIHTLYSGRTVEINNTDAEGRLVLSDGVVYAARDLKATTIVDIATLTGAQGTATGKYHAALVCNRSALESSARRAGRRAGELAHPLPFAPELHFPEFRSTVADMKNSVADRGNAQPSCAALFILSHLGFEWTGDWLHIDMASPAHCGERATGYGVALLNVLFGAHTRSKLLQAVSPSHVIEL